MTQKHRFFKAILGGDIKNIKFLLTNNPSLLHSVNHIGHNVLLLALQIGDMRKRKRIFRYFLSNGADTCYIDPVDSRDLLSWACHWGRAEQVRELLNRYEFDIDFRHADTNGDVALHHAMVSESVEVIKLLIKEMVRFSIPLDIPNKEGLTPYLMARKLGFDHLAQVLVNEGGVSPKQFDLVHFRTGNEWSAIGLEARAQESQQERQKYEQRQRLRGFKPSTQTNCVKLPSIRVITSDNEVMHVQNSARLEGTKKVTFQGSQAGTSNHSTVHYTPSISGSVSSQAKSVTSSGIVRNLMTRPLHPIMTRNITALDLLAARKKKTNEGANSVDCSGRLPVLMDIAAAQSSEAFLPPIPKPKPKPKVSVEKPPAKPNNAKPDLAAMIKRMCKPKPQNKMSALALFKNQVNLAKQKRSGKVV